MDLGYKLKTENPKKTANVFSQLLFSWIIPLIRKGTKCSLEIIDLYKVLDKDKSKPLTDNLEKYWFEQVNNAKKFNTVPSFFKALMKTFFVELALYGIMWVFAYVILVSLRPLLLGQLIELFMDRTTDRTNEIYIYSVALIGVALLTAFAWHHTNFALQAIGMRIRVAASAMVYRKIIRLNQKALGQTATGQVVNLLSNDVNRFDLVTGPIHVLWSMPFQVAGFMYLIWIQMGIAMLPGVITMALISLPVQGYLAKLTGVFREKVSKKTDSRVKLMSEVISGIQVIKMYAWEKPFEKIIKVARANEINDITIVSYLRGVYSSCMVFLDRTAMFATIITYTLLGNHLTAAKVFSLAQTFNILQMSMAIWYPQAISYGAEALVSIKRIQEFLVMEEREETSIEKSEISGVKLTNINASWSPAVNTLQQITLQVPPGTLCAVIGPVGAGKSSLLQLLLGELPAQSGKIQIGEKISYSSQEPWLFQSTVRNNILFGQPFEKRWYEKVVSVCALEKDFEQFPQGDQTVAGDKGVSLSGGQRARINLARAIYRKADVYLMDDPLSAVDTHVGKHLFEQCITRHLAGKTRILVTHQLQYLKKANLIVIINNGRIEAQGTFEELSKCELDFSKMLVNADETTENTENTTRLENNFGSSRHSSIALSRKISTMSAASSHLSDLDHLQDNLMEEEDEDGMRNIEGSKPFKNYLLATRNVCFLILIATLLILAQGFNAAVDFWVTVWTSQEEIRYSSPQLEVVPLQDAAEFNSTGNFVYTAQTNSADFFDYIEMDGVIHKLVKTNYAMYIYGSLVALAIILTIIRSFAFCKACMMSSVNLHSRIFHALLEAPMRFFDINPSGRILNRFSKDMGAIDEILPRVLLDAIQITLVMVGILVNIAITNPYIVIAMVILGAVFLKFRTWYIATAKVIKHIEGTTKSPVFSHLNSTLTGIITIRASNVEDVLIEEFDDHQDVHSSAWFLSIACISSFGLWLDLIAVIFLACVTFCFVILNQSTEMNGSYVGLAISQCLTLTGMLQYGMRQSAEVINQLTSVERVLQYTKIDTEGPFETTKGSKPEDHWPKKGLIEFKNMSLKYVENDPPVLRNLNFTIKAGEKIGIVGRTGAGKSSLITALFRLAPLEGSIVIDGVNTKDVGLTDLRRKISIIPQDPVLFAATLRYNLDPFNEFDDAKIWKALEQVELKDSVDSLDFMVAESGSNFSLGQRQLICLARAVLKNNSILVLDEATANVDPGTDILIQATIRERFKYCTVLTIAHRLNTIMDSDKVLVMSFGSMIEFDHPHNLLQIPEGHFHKMLLQTGPSMTSALKEIAMAAYEEKKTENGSL